MARSHCRQALIVDPNLFLAALHDDASRWFVGALFKYWTYIHFVLDESPAAPPGAATPGRSSEEHSLYLFYQTLEHKHPDLHVRFKELMERITRPDPGIVFRPATLTPTQKRQVKSFHCDQSVEPTMLALGASGALCAWVCVVGDGSDWQLVHLPTDPPPWSIRGVDHPNTCKRLQGKPTFKRLRVKAALDAQGALTNWAERAVDYIYPRTQLQLEQFVADCDEHESQFVEFKQPDPSTHAHDGSARSSPFLTWEIMDSAMESVCAMANTKGGKVVIGVKDGNGKVVAMDGFVPSYGKRARPDPAHPDRIPGRYPVHPCSYEQLCDVIHGHLGKIEPKLCQPDEVRFEVFYLENGHAVIVIEVEQAGAINGIDYHFQPVIYERKRNRCGLTFAYKRIAARDEKGDPLTPEQIAHPERRSPDDLDFESEGPSEEAA